MAKISSVIDDQNKRRDDYLKGKNKDKHTSHRGKVMGNSQVFKEVKHNPAATKASAFVNKQKKYQTKYNTAADKIEKRAGKTVAAANADTIASGAKTASTFAKIIADATRPVGPNAARQEKSPLSRLGRAAENAAPKLDKTANQYFRKSEKQLQEAKEGLGKAGQVAVDLGFAGTQLAGDAALNLVAPGAGLASMGVRGFGHGVNTANEQDVTGARAVAYGLGTAAIEAGTEKISAAAKPLRAIYGKGFADDALSKLTRKLTGDSKGRKILAEIGRSAAGEAGEEALADILQVPLQNITLQNGAQFDAEMWADTAYDALLGGILGGALGTAGAVSDRVQNQSNNRAKVLADAMQKARGKNQGVYKEDTKKTAIPSKGTAVRDYQKIEHHGNILDTVRANLDFVSNDSSVANLTGKEFQKTSDDPRSLRTKVIDFFNSIGNKVTREDIGDIELNSSGARDSLAHGYGKLKASTFAALPNVLKSGKVIAHNSPYEGHNYDSYIISAPVMVGGERVYVGALVIKDRTQRYKLHEVLTTNESGAPLFQSEATGQNDDGPLRNDTPLGESGDSPTTNNIAQINRNINNNSASSTHISARNADNVGTRTIKAFQYEHPEMRQYYREAAEDLLTDADLSLQSGTHRRKERGAQGNRYVQETIASPIVKNAMDMGLSRSDIIRGAEDIIKDEGAENNANAKRVELVLDDMVQNGYRTMVGRSVAPNEDYIAAKKEIPGYVEEEREELPIWDMDENDGLGAADRGSLNTAYQNLQEESSRFYPEGANAARPVDVPMFDANGNPISKSASTVLGAKAIPDEAVGDIEQMIADGMLSYKTVKDHDSLARARVKISRKGFDGALEEFRSEVEKGKVSKDLVTLGQTLLNNAANSGDGHAMAEILMLYRSLNTVAGQAMQASSIFRKLNPESQLYAIRRTVDGLNETQKAIKKKYHVEISQELIDKFLQQTDQDGRDAVMKEIYQDVADQVPGSWKEKFDSWRYMAMLTNPRTHIRNIVGNAFFQPIRIIKNGIAAGMEAGLSKAGVQIERTKSFGVSPELYRAAWNDYNNAKDILGGSKYNEIEDEIEKRRRIYTSPVLGKGLEKIRRVNFALLETEDAVAKRVTYADSLAGYLHAHGVTAEQLESGKANSKVLTDARNYAAQEALKATYQDRNKLSNTVVKVTKDLGVLGDAVMPFKRTPANLLARGLEYSPVGAVKSVYDGLTKIKSGEKTAAEVIDEAAAGLTGSALLAFGAQLFLSGLVKGSQGDDKDDKWAQLLGHQGYSLELPDGTSVTLDWLAPASLPFFMGVELASSVGENGWDAESIWSAVKSVANPMLELSMLQSVNDLIDSVQYAEDAPLMAMVPSAIVSYFTQFIPTVGGQIERTAEEERMMTYTDKNGELPTDLQYALGRASSRIPGWDYQQIPYIDEWGREEETGTPFMRAFHNFLNPSYVSQVEMDKIEKELQRVRDATGETSVFPSRAERTVTMGGEEKNLTASEYEKYAKQLGKERYNLLKDAVVSSAYQDLSDADKVAFTEYAYKYARSMAEYDQFGKEPASKWYLEARKSGDVVGAIRDHVLYGGNEKVKKAVENVGITREQYEAITPGADTNGNGGVSQEELKNYLNQQDFSRSQKAALWKLINPRWKHNPYA